MGKIDIRSLARKNVLDLRPYSSARDEYEGTGSIMLDANENPFNSPYNRYPDPHQKVLKRLISGHYDVPAGSIFLGNGSDEAIDLIIRAFCEPGISNIISIDPSYGMYEVCAGVNNVEFRKVSLREDFSIDSSALLAAADSNSRVIFLCSPNNPGANLLDSNELLKIITGFRGIVVVDEAYIDFSGEKSLSGRIPEHNNLIILRTFSKAWGMAGVRLGMAFADREIITILDKIKYPYNINCLTQELMISQLSGRGINRNWISMIIEQRSELGRRLMEYDFVMRVYPSDANFLLVKMKDPVPLYNFLRSKGIIVRDRSRVHLCEGCLRITVGSPEENKLLLNCLSEYIGQQ